MLKALAALGVGLAAVVGGAPLAWAQAYTTGQSVFATPSGASNGWYSGCIVGSGRNNNSYQVECGGTTWWVSSDHISTVAPAAGPDPMRPGQILTPTITPSHPAQATRATAAAPPAPLAQNSLNEPARPNTGGGAAAEMHRRIEQDKIDARSAVLAVGKYSCYAGGQYTFSDLYITGPHSYRVEPGGAGAYSYAAGALTFTSGPYAGAYSRMVDGHTVGVSAKGNTNLGTQCGLTK